MFIIQIQQFLNLLFLIILAYIFEYLYLDWSMLFVIALFTLCIEHLFMYIKYNKITYFSFSSFITAFGVMFMMVAENIWIYMFAIILGVGQKYFFTVSKRHFFNPSNFALLAAMFFFYNDAHIVLGQLGDDAYLRIIVIVLATLILYRVKRWIIPTVFSIMYVFMQFIFVVFYDPVLIIEDIYLRFYSVSFILFLVFMLTDPRTTPAYWRHQIIFSILLAALSTGLDRYYGFRVQHLFMALFIFSPLFVMFTLYIEQKVKTKEIVKFTVLLFLVLAVIISIESNPPYYFEMDR